MSSELFPEKEMNIAIEGAFEAMGPDMARIMRGQIRQAGVGDTDRTINSVTWATARAVGRDMVTGKALDTDVISLTGNPKEMHIGTAVPYAKYIDAGSQSHQQSSGGAESEEFVRRMIAWAETHGWVSDNGSGVLTEEDIYPLLKSIRDHGTDAHPFIENSKSAVGAVAGKAFSAAMYPFIKKVLGARRGKKTVIDVHIS